MDRIIDKIQSPNDVAMLTLAQKQQLAMEVREFLIQSLSVTGGHLAPNLGVVELTIAMHSVLNPESKIIWDVGHQSYVHKILTGRIGGFSDLRQLDGMSGFPKRSESPYDHFDTGHSSTSVSAALGFAAVERISNEENFTFKKQDVPSDKVEKNKVDSMSQNSGRRRDVFAVIGDGALTGGMAYEAINHIGNTGEHVKIILNDNQMSISHNVGGLVSAIRASKGYSNIKKGTKNVLFCIPLIGKPIAKALSAIKRAFRSFFVGKGQIFEDLGIKYLGEVDGHSIIKLEKALTRLKNYDGPAALHVHTIKGKGYKPAENNPILYHGVGAFDPEKGVQSKSKKNFSSVFGTKLTELASRDPRVVAVSAAMISGTGLMEFADTFPTRIFDVGIAEQHAVTMSAAMAIGGLKPFVAIYSTFLQRAYDQVVHDVCLQNAPVVFCIDRAGLVGADGETHQGIFDISYLSHIPNIEIYSVSRYSQLENLLEKSLTFDYPVAIRYPRGVEIDGDNKSNEVISFQQLALNSSKKLNETNKSSASSIASDDQSMIENKNKKAAILSTGRAVKVAREVSEKYFDGKLSVYEIIKIKPFDESTLELIKSLDYIFTIEDHVITGGFGSLVQEAIKEGAIVLKSGFDQFVPHGTADELYERYGLSAEVIADKIRKTLG